MLPAWGHLTGASWYQTQGGIQQTPAAEAACQEAGGAPLSLGRGEVGGVGLLGLVPRPMHNGPSWFPAKSSCF